MSRDRELSRRDFLRLRRTERGRLLEPEWLENMAGAARIHAAVAAFRARGGVVE